MENEWDIKFVQHYIIEPLTSGSCLSHKVSFPNTSMYPSIHPSIHPLSLEVNVFCNHWQCFTIISKITGNNFQLFRTAGEFEIKHICGLSSMCIWCCANAAILLPLTHFQIKVPTSQTSHHHMGPDLTKDVAYGSVSAGRGKWAKPGLAESRKYWPVFKAL